MSNAQYLTILQYYDYDKKQPRLRSYIRILTLYGMSLALNRHFFYIKDFICLHHSKDLIFNMLSSEILFVSVSDLLPVCSSRRASVYIRDHQNRAVLITHTVESVSLLENLINRMLLIFPRGPLCFCAVVCVVSANLSFSTCGCHSFSWFIKGFPQMSLLFFLPNKTLLCLSSPAVPTLSHRGLVPPSGQMVRCTLTALLDWGLHLRLCS